ncbi:Uncharacterized protein (Fragment) OS=uncultured bacterium PE=4 SV=1 [Gemmata massiliana]|uniref:Uncharacterized protein n=1 Tax=Gemmata massiliana TaxID=1210884 RepID=A0A6P2DIX1_9BACT
MSDETKGGVPPPRYRDGEGHHRLIMDEQEWLARPAMWGVDELPAEVRERKLNLFGFYHQTRLAQFIPCEVCRRSFQEMISEECAVFGGTAEELRQRYTDSHPTGAPRCAGWGLWGASINYARGIMCSAEARNQTWNVLLDITHFSAPSVRWTSDWKSWELALVLDLIGPNPFRPISFFPEWQTDTTTSLARGMYESRDFSAMPILADALQDAGCDNTDILNHCRETSLPHVRGCWVVDLVLGKQ